ncbi:MAG TPA: DPP IV N-terminal domain-containing protein, partial [Gemmataceae bacterium]|nr:DPP IV N-terminal domain-containing protein [Gemmataceae bacterium]
VVCTCPAWSDEITEAPQQRRPGASARGVYKATITPHWYADNTRFWYRNDLRGGAKEFVVVDAKKSTRQPAFDHARLAAALSKAAGKEFKLERLPFDSIEFPADLKTVRFQVEKTVWQCTLDTYECTEVKGAALFIDPAAQTASRRVDEQTEPVLLDAPAPEDTDPPPQDQSGPGRQARSASPKSPDGKWLALVKDNNVWLRGTSPDDKEVQLSNDGKEGNTYGVLNWSSDSKTLAAFRIEPGDRKEVYLIQSSPPGGGRAKLQQRAYDLPGDKYTAYELNLFSIEGPKQIKPQVERIDFGFPQLHWSADGSKVAFQKVDRGHQRFRLIEVNVKDGAAQALIDEKSKTFIWTAHTEMVGLQPVTWLQKTPEIIYASEQDGWRHLYLIDAQTGKIKNQITHGEWVVRGVERIDEEKRQVWFRASGKNSNQDPYFVYFYRVDFDGAHLTALTEANGNHTVQLSPDRNYLIDTYSRVDMPPVHELRRSADGKLVTALEKADISELQESGWKPPEVFTAKGRDGKTDIWGIIVRPRNFDPAAKYAVIESIYAGPHGSFVPKSFSGFNRFGDLTNLGFVVAQIDGMGTANRSKAFHDVCWKNLKDAGFPDRILWHQAVAKKYPWYDISRVGIYGTSAGGQSSTGALLFHPEFYKAAVSACGCHDNRMDKASWNEQWMGYPVGPQYAENSNITHAGNLKGKLLLIVGELDTNVPPEST